MALDTCHWHMSLLCLCHMSLLRRRVSFLRIASALSARAGACCWCVLLVLCLPRVAWVVTGGAGCSAHPVLTLFARRHSLLGLQVRDQTQMARDGSAAQFAAAQLAARPDGDPVNLGSGGLLNGMWIAHDHSARPLNAPSASCLGFMSWQHNLKRHAALLACLLACRLYFASCLQPLFECLLTGVCALQEASAAILAPFSSSRTLTCTR